MFDVYITVKCPVISLCYRYLPKSAKRYGVYTGRCMENSNFPTMENLQGLFQIRHTRFEQPHKIYPRCISGINFHNFHSQEERNLALVYET